MAGGTGIGKTYSTYKERTTAPATPAATYDRLYFTSAGLYYINSAGTAIPVKAGFAVDYAADVGSNDTYVITLSPAPAALAAGMVVHFKANTANTGAATLNVNGLGAKNILKNHDQTLADGDIEANQIVTVVYDGTQFQMQSQTGTAVENADSPTFGTVTTTGGIELGNASDTTLTRTGAGAVAVEGKAVQLAGVEIVPTNYKTIFIPAAAMTPTATNGATGASTEYATNDINIDYLAFDGATEQFAEFQCPMPEDWDRSTIKAKFFWTSATGSTAGDTVEWEIAAGALSDSDAIDAALGTAQVISDTLLADNGTDLQVSGATPALTVGGTPALGDLVHFKVSRNVGGTDDMTEDAWLFGAWVQYKAVNAVASW